MTDPNVVQARKSLASDLIDEINRIKTENVPALAKHPGMDGEARARELAVLFVREALHTAGLGDMIGQRDELMLERDDLKRRLSSTAQQMDDAAKRVARLEKDSEDKKEWTRPDVAEQMATVLRRVIYLEQPEECLPAACDAIKAYDAK